MTYGDLGQIGKRLYPEKLGEEIPESSLATVAEDLGRRANDEVKNGRPYAGDALIEALRDGYRAVQHAYYASDPSKSLTEFEEVAKQGTGQAVVNPPYDVKATPKQNARSDFEDTPKAPNGVNINGPLTRSPDPSAQAAKADEQLSAALNGINPGSVTKTTVDHSKEEAERVAKQTAQQLRRHSITPDQLENMRRQLGPEQFKDWYGDDPVPAAAPASTDPKAIRKGIAKKSVDDIAALAKEESDPAVLQEYMNEIAARQKKGGPSASSRDFWKNKDSYEAVAARIAGITGVDKSMDFYAASGAKRLTDAQEKNLRSAVEGLSYNEDGSFANQGAASQSLYPAKDSFGPDHKYPGETQQTYQARMKARADYEAQQKAAGERATAIQAYVDEYNASLPKGAAPLRAEDYIMQDDNAHGWQQPGMFASKEAKEVYATYDDIYQKTKDEYAAKMREQQAILGNPSLDPKTRSEARTLYDELKAERQTTLEGLVNNYKEVQDGVKTGDEAKKQKAAETAKEIGKGAGLLGGGTALAGLGAALGGIPGLGLGVAAGGALLAYGTASPEQREKMDAAIKEAEPEIYKGAGEVGQRLGEMANKQTPELLPDYNERAQYEGEVRDEAATQRDFQRRQEAQAGRNAGIMGGEWTETQANAAGNIAARQLEAGKGGGGAAIARMQAANDARQQTQGQNLKEAVTRKDAMLDRAQKSSEGAARLETGATLSAAERAVQQHQYTEGLKNNALADQAQDRDTATNPTNNVMPSADAIPQEEVNTAEQKPGTAAPDEVQPQGLKIVVLQQGNEYVYDTPERIKSIFEKNNPNFPKPYKNGTYENQGTNKDATIIITGAEGGDSAGAGSVTEGVQAAATEEPKPPPPPAQNPSSTPPPSGGTEPVKTLYGGTNVSQTAPAGLTIVCTKTDGSDTRKYTGPSIATFEANNPEFPKPYRDGTWKNYADSGWNVQITGSGNTASVTA